MVCYAILFGFFNGNPCERSPFPATRTGVS